MKQPLAVQKRRRGETTDPWPSVARLRTPKPRLIVALERLPSAREISAVLRELRQFDAHALFDLAYVPQPGVRGTVRIGRQVSEIHGHPESFDIEELLPLAHWSEQEKERLASHAAYVMCTPKTSTPNAYEQYLNLYRIAWAYGRVGGLCGVVNPLAMSFTPPVAVQNLLSDEMIGQCRERLPPQLFTGFAQYFATGGVWCATKGQEVFGVSNLAYFLAGKNTEWVFGELWKLFLFAYEEGGIFAPGENVTFASDPTPLRLHRVPDVAPGWEPHLETPGGTLILVPQAVSAS